MVSPSTVFYMEEFSTNERCGFQDHGGGGSVTHLPWVFYVEEASTGGGGAEGPPHHPRVEALGAEGLSKGWCVCFVFLSKQGGGDNGRVLSQGGVLQRFEWASARNAHCFELLLC